MSRRERWLLIGLGLVTALLPILGLWQQVRYNKAQHAVAEFVQLEAQARADDAEGPALVRQARFEVQRSLERGDFAAALQRLAALKEENERAADTKGRTRGMGVDELWPPGSPARRQARLALRLLVQKQKEGYDVTAAQETLMRVAEEARAGRKKQALAAFADMELLVRTAALRPGFRTAQLRLAPPLAPGQEGGVLGAAAPGVRRPRTRGMDGNAPRNAAAVSPAQVQQVLQFFRLVLPQLIERAEPEQQGFLRRLQPVGAELEAAYRGGKDIRPALPLLQKLGDALRSRDPSQAEKLLQQVRGALRTAKPLPQSPAPPSGRLAPPAMPPAAASPRRQIVPPTARQKASSPARPGTPAVAPQLSPERILQALDMVREMPEPVYREQRPRLAQMINAALARAGQTVEPRPRNAPPSSKPAAPGATPRGTSGEARADRAGLSVGEAATLRLGLSTRGEITGLWGGGRDLASGLSPGGFFVVVGDGAEVPLRGDFKREGATVSGRLIHSAGSLLVTCGQEADDLQVRVTLRPDREENRPVQAGALVLRIPLRAAGWRWEAGAEPQVIAVDETYTVNAGAGELTPVTLQGSGLRLKVTAPAAAAISYDPAGGSLSVRFALPSGQETANYEVRLSAGG